LPVLTIIFNNSRYNAVRRATLGMFKDGVAGEDDGVSRRSRSGSAFEGLSRAQVGSANAWVPAPGALNAPRMPC
jgi:hypothetical protein